MRERHCALVGITLSLVDSRQSSIPRVNVVQHATETSNHGAMIVRKSSGRRHTNYWTPPISESNESPSVLASR